MTTWQPGTVLISDYFFAEALGIWHKDLSYRTYDKGADNGSQPKGSSKQKTCDYKKAVCQDTDNTKRLACFVADDNGHQIIGTCSCFRFDHDGHAKSKDDTSCHKDNDTYCHGKGTVDIVSKQDGKKIDNRSAQKHTDDRSDSNIASVNEKQDQDDEKADYHVRTSVSPVKGSRPWNTAEDTLHKDVKGVGSQICLNKKSYTQVSNRQTENQ